MDESGNVLVGNRYQLLNKLGAGGMGAVYRAYDRLNRQTVALKRVLRPTDQLDITDQLDPETTYTQIALAHEFQTLASLRHPHVISVLDYGFDDQQQPYFTMSYLEGAHPISQAGQSKPTETKVQLLIEMLQALVYLHQRGIVHRDLKPDNALVTAEDQVKVLDFGISIKREQIAEDSGEQVSGTLAYMAPEVIQGEAVSEAADLYAVGVIAYELFAGHHPFDLTNLSQLIQDVLFTPVDVLSLNLNPNLADILLRLLKKTPQERFASAREVITYLSDAIDQPIPLETAAIRESFLQAAQFVGREKELAQLTDALAQAMEGHGSSWLIGGESGVGKSRLIDELRTQALVKGALVLHGQGIAEGGFTYQLWREPLRRLVLSSQLSDLDAGVLKQIVPDMNELLDRTIPDVPELDGRTGQQRLHNTILDLFRSQQQPVVLILEDLHWAVESLDVLKQINTIVQDCPLLIIGDYRDDERPNLPGELSKMQVIKLDRLSDQGITELSVSMLGEAGKQPGVLELLKKETEGNVFFLVEIVRTLAEEAGQLSNIGYMTLPRQVFAGGVQQIVQRRLARIPQDAQVLLRLAAVAGRQLDLTLLRAIDPGIDVDEWLTVCSNAGVLDIMNERWRFAHDKLRDGVLRGLGDAERRTAHQRIAGTLEAVYASASDEYAGMIGEHYEQAGAFARAAGWYAKAGKHARVSFTPTSAITYYRKALEFWKTYGDANGEQTTLQVDVYQGLGEMLNWQANYAEAAEAFTTMQITAEKQGDRVAQSQAWRGLAANKMYQGNFRGALEDITRAEDIARAENARLELTKLLSLRGWSQFYLGNIEQALALGEQELAISEELHDQTQIAQSLNLLTAIHGTLGRYEQAAQECQRALDIFQDIGARELAMFQVGNLGMIADKRGDHLKALEHFQDALARARELGRRDAEMLYLNNMGGARVPLGEYLDAERNLLQVIDMSETTRFGQLSETYAFLAGAYLGLSKVEAARDAGLRALELGQHAHAAEYILAAWRMLGEVAACLPDPINIPGENGIPAQPYTAAACFAESDRICRETKMESERAHTLRAWARYELRQGDATRGTTMWREAQAIFAGLGATLEAARMADLPG